MSTGCTLTSSPLTIGYPTGIPTVNGDIVKIYPVPSADRVYIEQTNGGYTLAENHRYDGQVDNVTANHSGYTDAGYP
jgi:hypothetical protein